MKKEFIQLNEGLYIKCLKKGYECGKDGISYNEMLGYLKSLGVKTDEFEFQSYLFDWFFDHFFLNVIANSRTRELKITYQTNWNKTNTQLNEKAVLTFDSQQKYLDYLTLQDSNQRARKANKLSGIAIGITMLGFISSTTIGIIQICRTSPQMELKYSQQTSPKSQSVQANINLNPKIPIVNDTTPLKNKSIK